MRKPKSKKNALPAVVYIKQENDGDDNYLVVDMDLESLVDNDVTVIGTYELVSTKKFKQAVVPVD